MDSDMCTGFAPSFPHGFVGMVNFKDRFTAESFLYFLRSAHSHEVASSLTHLVTSVKHRLQDGQIGRWVTDNGLSFLGPEVRDAADALVQQRGFSVANDSDTLAVAERHWGVLERIMRTDLHHAGADECLWPWGAAQANRLLYYLPTSTHSPPQSPYQFTTGSSDPADLSWARTMYCDVTVTVPQRDRHGKLGARGADGCHLGYDPRRNCHFVYVPSLQRIGSFVVTEWREYSFEHCRRITSDTPVEYYENDDLTISSVTSSLVPRRYRALAAVRRLRVLVLFSGTHTDHELVTTLQRRGHSVVGKEILDGHDLSLKAEQHAVLANIASFDFVFISPPCTTCSIAFDPPLRVKPDHLLGVPGLAPRHQAMVNEANELYSFTSRVVIKCHSLHVRWAIESAASRSRHDAAHWPKHAANGFLWDILGPQLHAAGVPHEYVLFAQCAFGMPWQKYTGLFVDSRSHLAFSRLFSHALCTHSRHDKVLQGYDDVTGEANTSLAQSYGPQIASNIASAIEDACDRPSAQEGDLGAPDKTLAATHASPSSVTVTDDTERSLRAWTDELYTTDRDTISNLSDLCDRTACGIGDNTARAMAAMNKALEDDELEIWALDQRDHAYRVSEVGSVPVPKTVREAMKLKQWPLFKEAMESEIRGKLNNSAWSVVYVDQLASTS